jgi:hypothetical protein
MLSIITKKSIRKSISKELKMIIIKKRIKKKNINKK